MKRAMPPFGAASEIMTSNPGSLPPRSPAPRGVAPIPSSAAGPARRFRLPRALRVSLPLAVVAVGAGLLAPAGRLAWGQGGGDTNPPVIHLREGGSEITEGRRFNRPAQPVIEVTDESSVTVEATVDGAPFAAGGTVTGEGTHQLAVTATDASGNAASLQVGFEIDTVPPSFLSLDPPDGSFTATATVTLSGQVEGATAVTVDGQAATLNGQSFAAGPYTLAAGPRTFALAAADAAGNRVERTLRAIRDSTAPTVSIGQPAAGALVKEGTVDVSGTVADTNLAGVTVNGVAATVTGQTFLAQQVPLAEGSNSVVARAIDRAGTAAEAARTVVRDSEPPAVEITDPAAGTIVPGTSVTLRGTATDAHLDRVEVNGARAQLAGNVWSYTASLASGANSFNVRAFDRLGSSAPAAISVERDSEAPAVQIEQPAVGTRLPASTVSVSGTVDDEPGLTLTVNGAAATVTAGQWSISGVALLEGENTLTARARDAQGNEGVHTRLVVRDSVAPRLLRSDPASGALAIPGGTVFRLTFSEPLAAPAAADVRLETGSGQAIAATLTAAGDDLTLAPSASLPSATQVRVVLTAGLHDLAGNALAGAPATLTFFTADTAAPAAPVLAPAPPVALCAASLPLAGSAEAGAVVRVEGGAAAAESRADEQGHFSLSVTLVPETGNRLRLTAIDSGGNPSLPLVVEVIHDCLPPHVLAAERQGGGFRIGFSEGIAASSLSGSVQLASAEGAIAGSTALGAGGRTATFTPSAALPAVPLRLEVTAGVRDHAGNALAYPFSQVFGAQGGTGFVTGTVIDDATGRPLAGARVLVYATHGAPLPEPRPEQVTGPDGRFRLPASAATHDLTIARPGYTPAFRVVTVAAGRGTDLLDPRLTPIGASGSVPTSGGMLEAGDGGARWTLPANALAQETNVAVTGLSEQGLPTLLPYGWSPRGAAWLSLGGAALLAPAELSLPAEGGDGAVLTWVHLDLATLQWRVMGTAEVAGGRVEMEVPASAAGLAEGAYAAVEADAPQDPALAPPSPVLGAVLPAAPRPTGNEPTAASLTFSPEVVLPTQSSRATALFTLWEEAASGLALTLSIVEELTLADGSVRREAPYSADLVLYHAPGGAARSRFDLRPSGAAQSLPLHLGAENVTLRTYGGEAVAGNVVGPEGGTVTDDEGDRIDLPAGAVADPTAVGLGRHAGTSLGAAIPAGTELAGALDLDLGGVNLLVPASLSLALSPAPAAGEKGFLLQLVDLDGTPVFRPVAELQATGEGWTTSSITAGIASCATANMVA